MAADQDGVIALDIGGTFIKSGIVHSDGSVADEARQTPINSDGPADSIAATLRAIIGAELLRLGNGQVLGIGVGVPGPFDYQRGISLMRHKFAALYEQDVGALLRAGLAGQNVPVRFRNDAEATVAGEARYGAGHPYTRLVGLTLGTGLGSAFMAGNQPVKTGASVPPNGEVWNLPFGTLIADDYFSIRGLTARLQQVRPALSELVVAAELARAGDVEIRAVFAEFGADLGAFLKPLVAAFEAEVILLLGGIARSADLFGPDVQRVAGRAALNGQLGSRAGLVGAAALIL